MGATATNTIGIANAVASVNNLVNPSAGTAPGANFPATGTAPAARLNTLANLLNTCTTAASASATACASLFTQATASGGSAPANVLEAARNIALHPGNNVSGLYALAENSGVFAPAITAAPPDWTLYATYSGGGMNTPTTLAVDSKGNIWVASYFGVVSAFSTTGIPMFASGVTGNGLGTSYGLAIDASDNVWVTNEPGTQSSVSEFTSSGSAIADDTAGGIDYPVSIAIDTSGSLWVVDYGNSHLTLLASNGSPLSGASGYSSSIFSFPVAVAVDSNRNGYLANQGSTEIAKVSPDGSSITGIDCCNGAGGIAVDAQNNVWVANYYGNSVSFVSSSGTVINSNITGGGIIHPQGIAVDGAGTVWTANVLAPSLSEIAGANASSPGTVLSPSAGWAPDAGMLWPLAVAIDASGNLWVANYGSSSNGSITEFIGLAVPVKTPMLGPPQAP